MRNIDVGGLIAQKRAEARLAKTARAIARLIITTRRMPEGNTMFLILGVPEGRTNYDALLSWAVRYLESQPDRDILDVYVVLSAFDEYLRNRLEDLEPF
ncbi:MAG: hypothetical protein WD081_03715 [Gammaproteobacteria bacterium]